MYKITFSITKKQEKQITRLLGELGITEYFVETTEGINLVHLFSGSAEVPEAMKCFSPVAVERVDESSWINAWADSYTGHELTPNIYVRASGSALPEKRYNYIIEIDPRDSFGDGHHSTTRLCAGLLEEYLAGGNDPAGFSMLDMGAGSGILAMTGYILGVRDIELFDIDPKSVSMTAKNFGLNGITGISPFRADLYMFRPERRYDIITANLLTGLVEDNIDTIISAMQMDGITILSGISVKWTDEVKRLFVEKELVISRHRKLEGWNGFMLKKRSAK